MVIRSTLLNLAFLLFSTISFTSTILISTFPASAVARGSWSPSSDQSNYGNVHESVERFRQKIEDIRKNRDAGGSGNAGATGNNNPIGGGEKVDIPVPKSDDDLYYFFSVSRLINYFLQEFIVFVFVGM
jgi:hypothetical protein